MTIYNEATGTTLAISAEQATGFFQRGLGLIGKTSLPDGYALILDPCRSIHMAFMRIPLDVLHVDRSHRVVRVLEGIKPWRVGPIVRQGRYVIELPVGTIFRTRTKVGDQLRLDTTKH